MAYNIKNNVGFATAVPLPEALPIDANKQHLLMQQRESSNYRLSSSGLKSHEANDDQIKQLHKQGFPTGLAKALSSSTNFFPLRIWVIDNSGSMQKNDGHRIIETVKKNDVKIVPSTRWAEIQECVNYHSQLGALLHSPTSFRLLNDPGAMVGSQRFGVAEMGPQSIPQEVQQVREIMSKARPGGVTPLTQHIIDIQQSVREMAPQLKQDGKRVAIILATDGLPTNAEGYGGEYESNLFVQSLRSLEGLPVWVVIRLCTDEDDVVDFYNDLDEQLELSIEVLDDFIGEANEVYKHNSWLNYALPLHRCREFGFHDRVFDMLDERTLTKGELRDFCVFLFGMDNFDGVSDPSINWKKFMEEIDALLQKEDKQWNPMKKKVTPWINMKQLDKIYGDSSSCSVM
mmetsp:Transcript_14592/g.21545  ORF Transcript_14592/g.21545 Transcript_14592/m.21545 type:complete len:401 (-) Transcript_14592:529-1731(-)|eukprot:CAMPEP_0195508470 /NCGR_PEP_ID=MMETSP0794_2-20130614/1667_1 /TAXON_ID=515487 /ORGANISM="Stephanopyxis turris, Strain CCMP 815" /LENGTH=400 /DNA_ID=CAMNT_0040635437 /DNA_START=144 /DNA_END=1346 /DNA_ORIENTATION=-